jgi:hypothetical protein
MWQVDSDQELRGQTTPLGTARFARMFFMNLVEWAKKTHPTALVDDHLANN